MAMTGENDRQMPVSGGIDRAMLDGLAAEVAASGLSPKRLRHVLAVRDMAARLAELYCPEDTELLQAAEYILAGGNSQVILCERGIRTFETDSRATLDIAAIPVVKRLSHLPVIVDPSHAAGRAELVAPLALAAAAAGADGLMVEVHDRPACALSDGAQALSCDQFDALARQVRQLLPHAYR